MKKRIISAIVALMAVFMFAGCTGGGGTATSAPPASTAPATTAPAESEAPATTAPVESEAPATTAPAN